MNAISFLFEWFLPIWGMLFATVGIISFIVYVIKDRKK